MRTHLLVLTLFSIGLLSAQPGTISEHLKIDQFGYRPGDEKICVINNPTDGFDFDAGDFYTPGVTLHVRKVSDNSLVYSATRASWNGGASYDQSGDQIWWFNFSTVTTPGSYYIYDPTNNTKSFDFDIREDVYTDVMKQAVRMFYYQRSGFAKTAPFAGVWTDGASHLGTQQDLDCRLVTNPQPSTARQLHGGWFDAGDYNKYVNFAYEPIHDMCLAYIERPDIWTDDYNIPESGNGIPDLLDELKWELDWLLRMQESNGSVLMKVSVTDFSAASPPSADTGFRRYGPAQGSSTRTAASMFAVAAIAFDLCGIPSMQLYADTLQQAAIDAWNWLVANPAYSSYNNAGFSSANPEMSAYQQLAVQTGAAILLFDLTGQATYKNYVDDHYDEMQPMQWWYWYPWESIIQDLLLYYSVLPDGTASVKNEIRTRFTSAMNNNTHLLPAIINSSCGYRGYLNDGDNVWGSNRPRGHNGTTFYNALEYSFNFNTATITNAALGYLNFLHGVNPINTVMLTNMYEFGAEKPCNEMYHSWFADGTVYDNAITSTYGPAPGYQPGGFNPNFVPDPAYGGTISPPQFQPSLKSYKDWNTSWPQNSWEITETSISNQGSYVKLISKFVPVPCVMTVTNAHDSGYGTLRQAVACASDGDTIRLDLPAGDTLILSAGTLLINKNLTILNLNPGHAPVKCNLAGTGISIAAGTTVHLHQLKIGGTGTNLIDNNGDLHLHHIKMEASDLSGPALVNDHEARVYGVVEIRN